MSIERDNDCVGCPQGCINCGRGDYLYVECDGCGETEGYFITDGDKHYCIDCYKTMLPQMITFTPDDEEITKYFYDGEWYDDDEIEERLNEDGDTGDAIVNDIAEREYERRFDY